MVGLREALRDRPVFDGQGLQSALAFIFKAVHR